MHTEILPISAPYALQRAIDTLQAGELVAIPTDTVYGLGTLAFSTTGALKIYQVKERPPEKALPILLGEFTQLKLVAEFVPETARKLAAAFWPGALTLILPKHPDIPKAVSALDTVGVRIPNHIFARELFQAAGPMAVSSANLSGHSNPTTAEDVYAQLKGSLPLILDGGRISGGIPSTVVDCTGADIRILREGTISRKMIGEALAKS